MEQRFESPGPADYERIERMRSWVRKYYVPDHRARHDTLEGKLHLLDVILESDWIRADETYKPQCLGICFGDILVQALGLDWVMVIDDDGRDPALSVAGTSITIFPTTMISKRIERGETVDPNDLFQWVVDTLEHMTREDR